VSPRSRRISGLVVALGLLLTVPASQAGAHATLSGVSPQRGAVLRAAPSAVVFRFSEPVTGTAGAVRVYGPRGARVDDGAAFHPGGRPKAYGVRLRSGLGRGTYTATYQVISADGHVVGAGSTFSIGAPSATSASVSTLLQRQRAGPVTRTALTVARGVQFAAIALGVGVLVFLIFVWPRALARVRGDAAPWEAAAAVFARRSRALVLWSAVAGAISAALAVGLDAASASGETLAGAVTGGALSDTLGARFGTVWGVAVVAWIVLGAGALALLRPDPDGTRRRAAFVLMLPAAYLVLVPGLGGHAGAVSPTWLLLPANALHVAAAAVWAGGIAALLFALRPATARLDAGDRTRLLVEVVGGFSAVALAAVLALVVSGVIQAIGFLGQVSDLVDTAYGRLVLVKSILLAGLVALGALQRRRSLPGLRAAGAQGMPPAAAGRLLRSLLRTEGALLLAVFVVTAVLSGTAPPSGVATGPANLSGRIGPAQFEATVDPATVGTNTIHLYLLDPRTGAQWDRASEVDVSARQPKRGIGPLEQKATKSGPGHYTVTGMQLGAPGTWVVQFSVRVGDFDQYTATRKVPVR
jgi:copper transport protein